MTPDTDLLGPFAMYTTDELPIGLDVTSRLAPQQTPGAPMTATLTLLAGAVDVSSAYLSGGVQVSGNILTQTVKQPMIGVYRLRITYTPTPPAVAGEQDTVDLLIEVPS